MSSKSILSDVESIETNSSSRSKKGLVLIATYNERANIAGLIERIHSTVPDSDILVIDDGSPDGTGDWLREASCSQPFIKFIDRGAKLGLGSAIQDGLIFARDHNYPWVVNLDADFSHDPERIPDLLRQDTDLVIGSRYVQGGGMVNCSWKRKFVSLCANRYASTLLGWPIRDCSSAYRCYRFNLLKSIQLENLRCSGYGFLEELLWEIYSQGFSIAEVPITYLEREQGTSKISVNEALGTIQVLHRLARRRVGNCFTRRAKPT